MNRTTREKKNTFVIGIKTRISCEQNQKLFKPHGERCHQIRKTNIKFM